MFLGRVEEWTSNLKGSQTLTVWNPQAEAGSKIGDLEENGWYVCRSCSTDLFTTLRPGNDLFALNRDVFAGLSNWALGQTWVGQQVLGVA